MTVKTAVIVEFNCDDPECLNGFGERFIADSILLAEEKARKKGWGKILLDPRTAKSGWCCPYCMMERNMKENKK